ncbi:MAG: FAD-binding protein [Candidatus Methanofastidiosia archaeon]|jgi:succinate dehydrogenase / fumarate reductase flavoprotein subunit
MKMIRGYPDYMRDSIEKVEKTRPHRLKATFDEMSLEERDEILNKYHPDYKPEAKREISFGPSKGQRVPHEVVDLIEAHPLVNPDDIDLSQIDYDTDVLIIGGGGGGTVAALWAYYTGTPVENILMVTKLRHGDSNSMMAQGGIQAADRPEDSPPRHYLDAIGGGHFTNKPELVRALTMDAPQIIKWHEKLGVMYDKDEKGVMMELAGGGTSRKRMHSARDYTGMEIMRTIRDETRNIGVPVLEFNPAVELLLDDEGKAAGAILYNMETEQYYVVRAKATILATGGFGRLHVQGFATTNHYGATADGLVLAYRAGVKLIDLDSVQYHPTGAAYPEQIVGLLVTEKVRGLGAQPVNKDGDMFVFPLEPRDVEAANLIRECYGRNNGITTPTGMRGVWLDSPMIDELHGEGTIKENLAAMVRMFDRFGIDMTQDPILVFPTLHYQNGGAEINARAETSVPGLFAGGEVEGGVHGKNRLMGNSLLDYNVFGRRAGINAAKYAQKVNLGKLSLDHVKKYEEALKNAGVKTDRKAPILLPEYRGKEVLSRALDIF